MTKPNNYGLLALAHALLFVVYILACQAESPPPPAKQTPADPGPAAAPRDEISQTPAPAAQEADAETEVLPPVDPSQSKTGDGVQSETSEKNTPAVQTERVTAPESTPSPAEELPEKTAVQTEKTGPELSPPILFLKERDAKVQNLLQEAPGDSLSPALRQQIKEHINATFDFAELGKQALGDHWNQRSQAERSEFVATFSGIIKEQNFDNFLRYYREGRFNYKEETVDGKNATVKAVVPIRQDQIEIIYHLHQTGNQWRIYDLVIDDASTVAGYQRQYARYIKKHSYEKLIERLHKQLETLHGKNI